MFLKQNTFVKSSDFKSVDLRKFDEKSKKPSNLSISKVSNIGAMMKKQAISPKGSSSNNINIYSNNENAKKPNNAISNIPSDFNKKIVSNSNINEDNNKKMISNTNVFNLQLYANKKKSAQKSEGKAYFSQFLENHQHKSSEQIKQDCIVQINNGKERIKFGFNLDEKNRNSKWLVDTLKEKIGISEAEQKIIGFSTVSGHILFDFILSLENHSLEKLKDIVLIVEPIWNNNYFLRSHNNRISLKSFEFLRLIGSGGFSKVFLARNKINGKFHAIKLIDRNFIRENSKEGIILNERNILAAMNHQFIIKLDFSFISSKYLVFAMEFCPGGELFYHLRRLKRLPEASARIYFIELCLGIRYLHKNNIIYRDIKPENILLDIDGHLKIADFGLAKPEMDKLGLAHSFCGSPEYMAPEMLLKQGHNESVDIYCLGALLYELIVGIPPFYSRDTSKMFERILEEEVVFPEGLEISRELRDLIEGLLVKNPNYRVGSNAGVREILAHPWCRKINLLDVENKKVEAPIKIDMFGFCFDEISDGEEIQKEIFEEKDDVFDLNVDDIEDEFADFYFEYEGFKRPSFIAPKPANEKEKTARQSLDGKYYINNYFVTESNTIKEKNNIKCNTETSVERKSKQKFQIEFKKTSKLKLQNFIMKQVSSPIKTLNSAKSKFEPKKPIEKDSKFLKEKENNFLNGSTNPNFFLRKSMNEIIKSINPSLINKSQLIAKLRREKSSLADTTNGFMNNSKRNMQVYTEPNEENPNSNLSTQAYLQSLKNSSRVMKKKEPEIFRKNK